jgi:hypothetical protein
VAAWQSAWALVAGSSVSSPDEGDRGFLDAGLFVRMVLEKTADETQSLRRRLRLELGKRDAGSGLGAAGPEAIHLTVRLAQVEPGVLLEPLLRLLPVLGPLEARERGIESGFELCGRGRAAHVAKRADEHFRIAGLCEGAEAFHVLDRKHAQPIAGKPVERA